LSILVIPIDGKPETIDYIKFGWLQRSRKLLIENRFWLQGMDLNHRPLGYEFNMWSWMGIVGPRDQQHTCSTYLLVLVGSVSLVSNLLAISSWCHLPEWCLCRANKASNSPINSNELA